MRLLSTAVVGLVCLAGCTSSDTPGTPHPVTSQSTTHARSASSGSASSSLPSGATSPDPSHVGSPAGTALATAAQRTLATMTLAQRVGQLIMVDCPSSYVAEATVTAIRRYAVGSVILDGNSERGVTRTHGITAQLQADSPAGVGLFVATDQEGGEVQRMRGPGFSSIPSAVVQGGTAPSLLRASATTWGRQLRAAGINLDLAPVLDTVPPDSPGNPPIGDLDREYGSTPAAVTSHGVAVAQGLADAGIDATVKHFPGLGRVTKNTDVSSGVTDDTTTRDDSYLAPFAAAIDEHVPFVMVSTASYARIDAGTPAVFSSTIVTGMLRHELGFTGVVISDDLGAAAQVAGYPPGQRAVDFVRAGGDIVLTVDANVVASMTAALIARATTDLAFARQIDAAALIVLQAKQARGLLS